ncbi:MAG: phosphoribosyl-ATP diphosphatase [Alphaproteobacteria bacterium]
MVSEILKDLYVILKQRKGADPSDSYVASLYHKGTQHISDKVMEEAAETIAEAIKGDKERLKEESADLLFHLSVLWADQGVSPEDVFAVLEKRFGQGGHAEKASRKK